MDIEEEGSVERNMDFEDVTEDGLEEAVSQQAPMLPAPACFSTHTAWPALIIPPSQLTAPPTLAPPKHTRAVPPNTAICTLHLTTHRTALVAPVQHLSHLPPPPRVLRSYGDFGEVDGRRQ